MHIIQADYCFPALEPYDGSQRFNIAILTAKDDVSKCIVSIMARAKGSSDTYTVRTLHKWIEYLGYGSLIIRGDPENVLTDVLNAVKGRRGEPTQVQQSTKGAKNALGLAEQAHWSVESQLRTLRLSFHERYAKHV